MPELEPITREEMLLDGQDLEPITRKEMFIKRIYDKTQVVPKPITREEMFLNKAGEGGGGDITIEQLNVTENGTYSESDKAYSPVVVNVPTPPVPENAYLLNSLSGLPADIASFTDGTDLPMASLKVAVTPYQDLHGYDGPWAGGAGKNKFDSDTVLSAFTKNNNKYVGMPSYVADNYVISGGFKTNTRYTLSYKAYNNTSTSSNFRFIFSYTDETEEIIGGFVDTTTEKVIVGTSAENKTISKIKRSYGNGVELTLYDIQLEEGSTATTFAPYSNICPIIGWDEAVVTVADDAESPTTSHEYTIDLDGTRYGGTLDATDGTFLDMIDHIASYNGEELPPAWISDRDVYTVGATPTIGAEVVYPRATPITVQLSPTQVKSLVGVNNINANCGQITEVKYFKKA